MNLFGMIEASGSAMQAERMRAEVVAANMANAETTRTAAGTPYRRQHVVFAAGSNGSEGADIGSQSFAAQSFAGQMGKLLPLLAPGQGLEPGPQAALFDRTGGSPGPAGEETSGVHIAGVVEDKAPPLKRYDPGHPDADAEGYVSYPDINPLTEMVDLMGATRAYGLNGSAVQAEKSMVLSALDIAK